MPALCQDWQLVYWQQLQFLLICITDNFCQFVTIFVSVSGRGVGVLRGRRAAEKSGRWPLPNLVPFPCFFPVRTPNTEHRAPLYLLKLKLNLVFYFSPEWAWAAARARERIKWPNSLPFIPICRPLPRATRFSLLYLNLDSNSNFSPLPP